LKDGVVTNRHRIRETLPTLRLAIEKGARLVLASHLGRPKGRPGSKISLRPAAKKLEELLGKPIAFAWIVSAGRRRPEQGLARRGSARTGNVRFHPTKKK